MTPTEVSALVLDYFRSWQIRDWDLMQSCLDPGFQFNSGTHQFDGAESFLAMCRQGPDWESVELLESMFSENQAALLYEGISLPGKNRIRTAEIITCKAAKIVKAEVVFTVLP